MYKGKPFELPESSNIIGFVYLIENETTGMKYIGKKQFYSKRTKPPLKGKVRKRKVIIESDWKSYCGSNDVLKEEVTDQKHTIRKTILKLCSSKGEMSYYEAKYQFETDAILDPLYYNSWISCKIHKSHINSP